MRWGLEHREERGIKGLGLAARWRGPGGYGEVLRVGMPLVLSMTSTTVMQFTDRIFLSRYSLETIAASGPASITAFLLMSFFMGTADYVSVFVAQYTGAVRPHRVGAALWQGIWFSLGAGVVLAVCGLAGGGLFRLAGHPPQVVALEAIYYQIFCFGAGFGVLNLCLSTFFSGRGMTVPVMLANMAGAALNIPLDYALINGAWGMPELGMAGAALATVAGWVFMCLIMVVLIFRRENQTRFRVRSAWRLEPGLLLRLLRFGAPGGAQFFIDMFTVTFLIFLVGRLGPTELAATNIAFSIDLMAVLPLVGLSVAVSVLTGQAMGRGRPDQAVRAVVSTLILCQGYLLVTCSIMVLAPEWLYGLFQTRDAGAGFAAVVEMGKLLLRFVALYSLMNGVVMSLYGLLKGAGDTRFVMFSQIACTLLTVVVPVLVLAWIGPLGLATLWWCLTVYVVGLAAVGLGRFFQGRWRSMRVIEDAEENEEALVEKGGVS